MQEILEIAMFFLKRLQGQNPSEVWLEIHHHAASGRLSNDETADLLHSASQKRDAHPTGHDMRFNFLRDVWWQARALCKMARSPVGFLTMPSLTCRVGSQVFHCEWCVEHVTPIDLHHLLMTSVLAVACFFLLRVVPRKQ